MGPDYGRNIAEGFKAFIVITLVVGVVIGAIIGLSIALFR